MKRIIPDIFCIYLLLINSINAFYVPGVAPVEFKNGDPIEVKAVKMTSTHTQLPYDYYSLPFCKPKNGIVYKSENLGEVLRGDRIVNTPYEVKMIQDVSCRILCEKHWSSVEQNIIKDRIADDYNVHLLVDNLPCATKTGTGFDHGYKLGYIQNKHFFINNHLNLIFYYHQVNNQELYRVVGFVVETYSYNWDSVKNLKDDTNSCVRPLNSDAGPQDVISESDKPLNIRFTYSVTWKPSDIKWASRWDIYLAMSDVEIHWFSIINSIVVIFFLTGLITLIIIRTLRRDIAKYNADDLTDEAIEQSGWKLVHGDIFRPPKYPRLFVAIIGSGVQIFLMSLITILFAMLGMLSPASRGALMNCAIFFYALMGSIAGFVSARIYKTIRGRRWKKAAFLTGVFYPGLVFSTCFILNFFIWKKSSSGAVPFSTMLSLLLIWFGVSLPLVYFGYYVGYKKPPIQNPVRTNLIPRQIPEQIWYLNPFFTMLVAGLLPFGAVFIELFFIFTAIWQNQFYYLFGFLFLVFIILVISCGQISIIMIYFQLCAENYHWWWRSLAVSGGSAIHMFMYSVYYFYSKLEISEFVPTLLYFVYSTIMVVTFWLLTSTIGFFSAYFFIKKIYSAIKID
ncbi:hypothetical protein PGB90_005860 [Kerria lacca]